MENRSGIFKGWITFSLLMLLAVPLLGWNVLPKGVLQSPSKQNSPASNVERGRELFMGNLHFKNEGPPCMGCHNIGSNGLLGGGALGPDLTNVTAKRSQPELNAILSNSGEIPVPVMRPIFAKHPLTAEERADLLAFMQASVGQPEINREWLVIGISLVGFVAAVLVLGFVYRNRLRGVRKALVNKAQKELL